MVKANENAAANTEVVLRNKWGNAYEQNLASAQRYLNGLSGVERDHFDNYYNNGVHALNDAQTLEFLYKNSIGAGNLPSGSALATEIKAIESLMRTDPKSYFGDIQLQARLRELYNLRDG